MINKHGRLLSMALAGAMTVGNMSMLMPMTAFAAGITLGADTTQHEITYKAVEGVTTTAEDGTTSNTTVSGTTVQSYTTAEATSFTKNGYTLDHFAVSDSLAYPKGDSLETLLH